MMELERDEATEARIERVKKHLPAGNDLTLIVLKGHLLVEEALDDLISLAFVEPEHLEDIKIIFSVKARLARASCGHLVWIGLWPMVDALNKIRNDLAHRLDSPKLRQLILHFLDLRKEHMPLLSEPLIDIRDWSAVSERFRADLSLLISQLIGAGMLVRAVQMQERKVD